MYQPSQLHAFLQSIGRHANKRLSQNFLVDGNVLRKIIEVSGLQKNDWVLEIGPGPGALTEQLLLYGAQVIAVEKDALFAEKLPRFKESFSHLEVFSDDILSFPVAKTFQKRLPTGTKAKVIANLPYHLTAPILSLLLPLHDIFFSLTLMVQKEVGDRMQAKANEPDYSSLSLFVDFFGDVKSHFVVNPTCFIPPPSVHSSVLHIELHPPHNEEDQEAFFRMTRTAFGKRRKMLRSSLRDLYSPSAIEQALLDLGHTATARPEELSLDHFIALFKILSQTPT